MKPVADVGDLSPAWLSRALGVDVRAVTCERVGTGQTAATYRLTLDAPDGPTSLVAKVAAGDESARKRVSGGFRNEVGFYTQVLPTVSIRAPACWYAAIRDDALQFTLLLEDLAPRTPGVQVDGCPTERAALSLRNLAGLHAPRWNDVTLFEASFLRRPSPDGAEFLGAVAASAAQVFLDRYGDDLGALDASTLQEAAAAIPQWLMMRYEPFTLVHGDYRLDNLMFAPAGQEVVAVDWQTLGVAPAARDVAYFLGTSLGVAQRRAAEEGLVAGYHFELVARGVADYPLDQCFDDYRLGLLQAPMIAMIGAAYATAGRSTSGDAMFIAMARRASAAIRDLGTLQLL